MEHNIPAMKKALSAVAVGAFIATASPPFIGVENAWADIPLTIIFHADNGKNVWAMNVNGKWKVNTATKGTFTYPDPKAGTNRFSLPIYNTTPRESKSGSERNLAFSFKRSGYITNGKWLVEDPKNPGKMITDKDGNPKYATPLRKTTYTTAEFRKEFGLSTNVKKVNLHACWFKSNDMAKTKVLEEKSQIIASLEPSQAFLSHVAQYSKSNNALPQGGTLFSVNNKTYFCQLFLMDELQDKVNESERWSCFVFSDGKNQKEFIIKNDYLGHGNDLDYRNGYLFVNVRPSAINEYPQQDRVNTYPIFIAYKVSGLEGTGQLTLEKLNTDKIVRATTIKNGKPVFRFANKIMTRTVSYTNKNNEKKGRLIVYLMDARGKYLRAYAYSKNTWKRISSLDKEISNEGAPFEEIAKKAGVEFVGQGISFRSDKHVIYQLRQGAFGYTYLCSYSNETRSKTYKYNGYLALPSAAYDFGEIESFHEKDNNWYFFSYNHMPNENKVNIISAPKQAIPSK